MIKNRERHFDLPAIALYKIVFKYADYDTLTSLAELAHQQNKRRAILNFVSSRLD